MMNKGRVVVPSPLPNSYYLKCIFQRRLEKLLVHSIFSNPLFSYLYELSKKGFTAKQFHIYRDNFFFRTLNTIPSLSHVLIKAAYHCDFRTLASVGRNLYEETGEGEANNSHSSLLECSYNTHGKIVFSLEPIPLQNVSQSTFILEETHYFVVEQRKLYTSANYGVALGAMLGQEMAADNMLRVFYETLFLPYKGYYRSNKFKDVELYFLCHLNGVEARHGQDARKAALHFCRNEEDIELVLNAAENFLDIQALLWDGFFNAMKKAEDNGISVPVCSISDKHTVFN